MNPRHVVQAAIDQLQPFAEGLLAQSWTTWGPSYVHVYVRMPGCDEDLFFTLGNREAAVDGEEFFTIAHRKLEAAAREKMDTRAIVALSPWLLQPGEYYYDGGVYRDGIVVAVSGVHAAVDHMLAAMIVEMIKALMIIDRDEHIAADDMTVS